MRTGILFRGETYILISYKPDIANEESIHIFMSEPVG